MLRRFLTSWFIVALMFILPASASAQSSYYFSVDKEVVHVYWNSDGTLSLDYTWIFTNQPGAHVIDFVDLGLPNDNYDFNTISADVNGAGVRVTTGYEGSGSGVAIDLGQYAIQPGQSATVHAHVARISNVLYKDDNDASYASAVFTPTWFGNSFVAGSTDMTVVYHLPPGVKPEEPRWHSAPSGFPAEPQTGFDSQGNITYTWYSPNASAAREYKFGASFPKSYIPETAIVTQPAFDFTGFIESLISNSINIICFGFFAFMFFGLPALSAIQGQRRKLQYMSPKIAIEGHGIKRGLTAVEAAILMEQPLDKIMTMILFGVVKKNAAAVAAREPLTLTINEPAPPGLHEYEIAFLRAFKQTDPKARRRELQKMTVDLVKSVAEKMKGFSRQETIEYYKRIMETAWEQVQKADTPEVQMTFFDQQLEWTMLDPDYDERSRRTFRGPVYVPMWWGNYDPAYRGLTSSAPPRGTSVSAAPSMPGQPSSRSLPQLPGADFAASMVTGVQTFSQKVIGNLSDFTSGVTNVTNPPPKPSSSSYRSGGGGCACACNANRVMHLNPTAAIMAWLILEERTQEESVRAVMSRYSVSKQQAKADLASFQAQLEDLIRPDGACPVHDFELETLMPFSARPSAPYRMDLAITYRCNNDCAHCYNARERNFPELDTDQWKRILDKLWELGVPHIVFTGGEATLRNDLPELIAHAESNGQITGLNTNARRLSDARYVQKLVDAGLDHVQITVESCDEQIHDAMMRAKGAFKQTIQGLKNALASKLYVMTNTTMLRTNVHKIPDTLDFLADIGVPTIGLNALIYSGHGLTVGTGLHERELQPILDMAVEKTSARGQRLIWYTPTQYCNFDPTQSNLGVKGCSASLYSMCIESNGNVLPCQSYYHPLGNFLADSWDSIWNHELSLRLRERKGLPAKCEGCPVVTECGGGCPLQFESHRASFGVNLPVVS